MKLFRSARTSARIACISMIMPLLTLQPAVADGRTSIAEAAEIADTTTDASTSPEYRKLLDEEHTSLLQALRESGLPMSQAGIDGARQTSAMAKQFWSDQAGYDFEVKANGAEDIRVLSGYRRLPDSILGPNSTIDREINHGATKAQQQHALFDADGVAFLFYLSEALGPKLGFAFLHAYKAGKISRAAALIKASEISTGAAKAFFAVPRPFTVAGNDIHLVPDDLVARDRKPYTAVAGAFPSGHTNVGYTDALLLAAMLPERFLPLVARAAGYGYSRIVLGVHYPLDVIGGRMIAERNVAHFLSDPRYRVLFATARTELRAALEKECAASLADCAAAADANADPWASSAQRRFYAFTMNFDLPSGEPPEGDAVQIPDGAEFLIEALRPDLSAPQRKALLQNTAGPAGDPLGDASASSWERIDLYEAALAAARR